MTPEELKKRLRRLIAEGIITRPPGKGRPPSTGASWLASQIGCSPNVVHSWLSKRNAITDVRAEQLERILSEAESEID